jgi:cytochrome c-type biogenesis protein CcmH/NrfG
VLNAAIERSQGEMQIYKTGLEAKTEAKKYEYQALAAKIEVAKTPYEGELKRFLAQWEMDVAARSKAVDAYANSSTVLGRIAESLASGINAIASQSVTE